MVLGQFLEALVYQAQQGIIHQPTAQTMLAILQVMTLAITPVATMAANQAEILKNINFRHLPALLQYLATQELNLKTIKQEILIEIDVVQGSRKVWEWALEPLLAARANARILSSTK